MKKFVSMLVFMTLLLLTAPSAMSQRVYCVDDFNGDTYSYAYETSTTDASCDVWKTEYWQKSDPGAYNDCLKSNARMKAVYKSGKCSPLVKKVHYFGSTKCEVEVSYKYKRLISKHCSGAEAEKYIKELEKMYR